MNQWQWLVCLVGVVVLSGCGDAPDGPARYEVSGAVNYKSRPVPRGSILFEPDTSAGGSGPQGYAEIHDGKFSTSAVGGKGVSAGPHIVRIEGFKLESEALADSSGENIVPMLFEEYKTTVRLPAENSTQNFDVPATTK